MFASGVRSAQGAADDATWMMILSRIAHILCVVVAIILGYTPAANAWFRQRRS